MQAKLNELFSALSDATRREILIMLLEDDMAVTDVHIHLICRCQPYLSI